MDSLRVGEAVQAACRSPPLGRGSAGCGGSEVWSASPHAPVPPQEDESRKWDPEERGWPPPEEVTQPLVTCSSHSGSPNPWKNTNKLANNVFLTFLFLVFTLQIKQDHITTLLITTSWHKEESPTTNSTTTFKNVFTYLMNCLKRPIVL